MARDEDRLSGTKTKFEDRPCREYTVSRANTQGYLRERVSSITVFSSDVTEAAYAICKVDVPQIANERKRCRARDCGHVEDRNLFSVLLIALRTTAIACGSERVEARVGT